MPYTQLATSGRKTSKYNIEEVGAQLESGIDDKLESVASPKVNEVCSPNDSMELAEYYGESMDFGNPDQDLI